MPAVDTVCDLLAAAAVEHANRPALTSSQGSLSYRDLAERSEALARMLAERGAGADKIIAVCLPRCADLIVSVLGVTLAGSAYLPLDPSYPAERLRFMMRDSGAKIVITTPDFEPLFSEFGDCTTILNLGPNLGPNLERKAGRGAGNASGAPRVAGSHLAYLIYTSGSTGQPKGVMVEHRSLLNHTRWFNAEFGLGPGDRVVQRTSLSFDASVWEIFSTLTSGAELVLYEGEAADVIALEQLLVGRSATVLQCVPSLLAALADWGCLARASSLRLVCCGGEPLGPDLAQRVHQARPVELVNLYGPTETTIDATFARIGEGLNAIPIGRPIAGARAYVVDRWGGMLGVGMPGELLIGGECVARGYHNLPEQTAAQFAADPFARDGRVYRSGDKVCWRADGTLQFLGRLDDQVKVRGHRVELGEVEAALRRMAGVTDAAAGIESDDSGSNSLVACVVATPGVAAAEIRACLREVLPAHLVPSRLALLDRLPLTPNGKIDRKALFDRSPGAARCETSDASKTAPLERRIAQIWQDTLDRGADLDVLSDFFEMGGHSLLALRVIARMRAELDVQVSLRTLFENSTPRALAHALSAPGEPVAKARPGQEGNRQRTPSFAQERMLFLQAWSGDASYNVPIGVRVAGDLSPERMEAALGAIVARHEVLRSRFEVRAEGNRVTIDPPAFVPVRAMDAQEWEAEWRRPFDLASEWPVRAAIVGDGPRRHILWFCFHHIAFDGLSEEIFWRQLAAGYNAPVAIPAASAAEPAFGFYDHASAERSWALSEDYERQLDHWRHTLAGAPERIHVPDRRWPDEGTQFFFTAVEAASLQRLAARNGVTIFMLALAGFAAALSRCTGERDLVIGTPVAGRSSQEVAGLIGLFVNMVPVRIRVAPDERFSSLLAKVREACLDAFDHQRVPLERLVEALGIAGYSAHHPIFQVSFAMESRAGYPVFAGLRLDPAEQPSGPPKFDLSITLRERADGGYDSLASFTSEAVSAGAAAGVQAQMRAILVDATSDADRRVSSPDPREPPQPVPEIAAAPGLAAPARLPRARADGTAPWETQRKIAMLWAEIVGRPPSDYHVSFFEEGGHSLLALRLLVRLKAELGATVTLRRLFDEPSVEGIARSVAAVAAPSHDDNAVPPPRDRPLSATPAQRGFWFLDQAHGSSGAYVLPIAMVLRGDPCPDSLRRALTAVIAQHEALRTGFLWRDDDLRLCISADAAPDLEIIDLPADADLDACLVEACLRPFDLLRGPGLRSILFNRSGKPPVLLLATHHIVADGRSWQIVIDDFWEAYAGCRAGVPAPPRPSRLNFSDHAAAAGRASDRAIDASSAAFWQQLGDSVPLSGWLPTAPGPAGSPARGGWEHLSLSRDACAHVRETARRARTTPFAVLTAALAKHLANWSGEPRFFIGVPYDERPAGMEGVVGLFVETLPIRIDVASGDGIDSLAVHIRDRLLAAHEHRLPLEQIVSLLRSPARAVTGPACQVMTTLQVLTEARGVAGDLAWEHLSIPLEAAKVDLSLHWAERDSGFEGTIAFAADRFDRAQIRQLARDIVLSLDPRSSAPAIPVAPAQARPAPDADAAASVDAAVPAPTFAGVFETIARVRPDAPAVEQQGAVMSYRELDRRANRLARHLVASGVASQAIVGMCCERSFDMIVAILAIAKAGAAFLPLDPAYPAARLAGIVEASRIACIVTHERARASLPCVSADIISLELSAPTIAACSPEPPERRARADDLAYVIYTSGSTGKPKGVMIEHRSLSNLVAAQRSLLASGPDARVLQFASPSFDASVWEIVAALCNGGTLILAAPDKLLPGAALADMLRDAAVTHVTLPPSALAITPSDRLPDLRCVVSAGEACPEPAAARWIGPGRRFINAYGPTEATVCATAGAVESLDGPPSIGRALRNMYVRILDETGAVCPTGVTGELHIGGEGLARGYLFDAEQTAERFIQDPFGRPGMRLYRTGDLARWTHRGDIDFIGRRDRQVKLRGYRIELGDVEHALAAMPGVRQGAVLVDGAAESARLVAFAVLHSSGDPREVRTGLESALPDYMVPSLIVPLEAIPQTPNGKTDYAALAQMGRHRAAGSDRPLPGVEMRIGEIWAAVIGGAMAGREENFFEVGGFSIAAVRAVSRIALAFGVDFSVADFMLHPTIAAQAAAITARIGAPGAASAPDARVVQALPSHAAAWRKGITRFYVTLPLDFAPSSTVTAAQFVDALQQLCQTNDALRLRFVERDGVLAYDVVEQPVMHVSTLSWPGDEPFQQQREAELGPFAGNDAAPTIVLRLWQRDGRLRHAMIAVSHMVFDGWSAQLFLRRLDAALGGAPPARSPSYADFIAHRNIALTPLRLARMARYWERTVSLASFPLAWREGEERPATFDTTAERVSQRFDGALTARIRAFCRAQGTTEFVFLATALALLAHLRSGGPRPMLKTIRMARETEAELAMIGFAIDVLPVVFAFSSKATVGEVLRKSAARLFRSFRYSGMPPPFLMEGVTPAYRSRAQIFYQHHPDAVSGAGYDGFSLAEGAVQPAKEDISLDTMFDEEGALIAHWTFSQSLFPAARAQRFSAQFVRICELMVDRPDSVVPSLDEALGRDPAGCDP